MVEFITRNVAAERSRAAVRGAEQSDLRRSRLRRGRFDLDEANRRRTDELARDAAIRETLLRAGGAGTVAQSPRAVPQGRGQGAAPQGSGIPQGSVTSLRDVQAGGGPPALQATSRHRPADVRGALGRGLAGVPGSGALAAEFTLQELDAEQKVAERMFELAATGDPRAALAFAEQQGLEFPKEFMPLIQDRAMAGALSRGWKTAVEMFPEAINARRRQEWFMQFARSLFTELKNGNLPGAASSARFIAGSTVRPELPAPATATDVAGNRRFLEGPRARERVFADARPQPKPGTDVPFSADVEAQKGRIAQAGRGGITPTQQRDNIEIDAARRELEASGLSREEILRRSQKATDTGFENPDYDPFVNRLVRKATQRKTGDDPDFEQFYRRVYGTSPSALDEEFSRVLEGTTGESDPPQSPPTPTPPVTSPSAQIEPSAAPAPKPPAPASLETPAQSPPPSRPSRRAAKPSVGEQIVIGGKSYEVLKHNPDGKVTIMDLATGRQFIAL